MTENLPAKQFTAALFDAYENKDLTAFLMAVCQNSMFDLLRNAFPVSYTHLLKYKNICIQCHNSPDADALAAAYGVYTYLKLHDINVSIIYSGDYEIQKKDLLYMIDICEIPVEYVKELPKTDLLLLVDGQYGRGNVYRFEADNIAMIDHHMPSMKKTENAFIDYSYQSCSTIVWELLKEEGYDVKANEKLSIAFLYGLYLSLIHI